MANVYSNYPRGLSDEKLVDAIDEYANEINELRIDIKLMSQTFEMDDGLRPEYDFTQLTVVARGQGRKRSTITVQLDMLPTVSP
jgi:hypothetical protein